MTEIRSLLLTIFVGLLVLTVMILIFTRGNESALTLKDRLEKAFDKEKFTVHVSDGTCYAVGTSRFTVSGIVPEYRDYVAEGGSVSILFTVTVDGRAGFRQELDYNDDYVLDSNELQLSSMSPITCESDGEQCNFLQTSIDFNTAQSDVIRLEDGGDVIKSKNIEEILTSQQSIHISAWKEVGLDADRVYPVTNEKLIEQRADFYLGSFILNTRC